MTTSRTVVVSLPSGAGVVRLDRGLLVTDEVGDGGGTFLNEDDPFQPVKTWVDENCSVVGGLLPPGAVGAEAVDDRGRRVAAVVGGGAYAVMLEQPHDGHEPIVCCRDASGAPVRRPWAADYPSVCVTDATEPCPSCGAVDWDEYTPHEEWRGGRGSNGRRPLAGRVVRGDHAVAACPRSGEPRCGAGRHAVRAAYHDRRRPARGLMLTVPGGPWVAVAEHADLTIAVAGHDAELASLRLEPIADPAAYLLGPEPPDD